MYGHGVTAEFLASLELTCPTFVVLDCADGKLSLSDITAPTQLPTTFESIIFEAIPSYLVKEFKPILKLAKDRPPAQN